MTQIPLEDTQGDVISKAQRGKGFSDDLLATKLGVPVDRIRQVKDGSRLDDAILSGVAEALDLRATALISLARKQRTVPLIEVKGLYAFSTPFRDMLVNSYLVVEVASGKAAMFDTGTDIQPVLQLLAENNWRLEAIFLTHTHGDHVLELDLLKEKTGAPAYVQDLEPIEGAESFSAGRTFSLGALPIETRSTIGHSRGGTTYVIHGLEVPLAVVGDAIFAGSMGGGGYSYAEALRTNREQILTLPLETVLCPGHGPLTTVQQELLENPFFP